MLRRDWLGGVGALVVGCRSLPIESRTTSAPVDKVFSDLHGLTTDVPDLRASDYAARKARVWERMNEVDVHAVVIEPGATMQYLSGVSWHRSERPFLLVLEHDGAEFWLVPAFEERRAREQLGDAKVTAWQENADPFAILANSLRSPRTIAIDGNARSSIVVGVRRVQPDATVHGQAPWLDAIRMQKDPVELAYLRRANEITKIAIAAVARQIRPGLRQSEIVDLFVRAQTEAGLSNIWCLALTGPAAAFPHGTHEDRVLQADDVILVDTGGALHGYQSDVTRTWAVGTPAPDVRAAWEAVRKAQQAALSLITQGTRCGDVDAKARAILQEAGYGDAYRYFTHRLGHGIGLEVHEQPYLVANNEQRLLPGMTMSNEPGVYIPGSFGVRIEDIVAVTDGEPDVFGPMIGAWDDPLANHDVEHMTPWPDSV